VIAGPNGAGKSTLIRALSGEWTLATGCVDFSQQHIQRMPAHAWAARHAVVPQATSLSFPFTVEEVIALGCSVPGFGLNLDRDVIGAAIAAIDLATLRHRPYPELSGGERQRVQFARALCQLWAGRAAPEDTILFLDEPTSNLDVAHQMQLLRAAKAEAQAGRTVVAVLHDLNLTAAFADQVLLLARGKLTTTGSPVDVLETALLSDVFDFPLRPNVVPPPGVPFVLPHAECGPKT
jgi:iron complex transport system ATP-binding protein